MTDCELRRVTTEDMVEVARLFRRSFQHTYPKFPKLHTAEEDLEYLSEEVFFNNEMWIAVDPHGQRIVGMIAFTSEMVNHLYLLPEMQRQGVGSALLELAKRKGTPLRLWTFQCNEIARKFYTKHGFKIVRETDGADNEERQPDVLFEWCP
jgi:ribosomal protein S18 acetylase RimI-like enzyme